MRIMLKYVGDDFKVGDVYLSFVTAVCGCSVGPRVLIRDAERLTNFHFYDCFCVASSEQKLLSLQAILKWLFVCFSVDDEPPGEHKGGGDFTKNVAESVTTINSSDDGIDDGETCH